MKYSLILYAFALKGPETLALLSSTKMSYFSPNLRECLHVLDMHRKPELEDYNIIVPEELM